jgi:predicted SAM-dependent methyltransferase
MRVFDSLTLLDDRPPFSADLIRSLGLRGINCGCGDNLRPGWLNTDMNGFSDRAESSSEVNRICVIEGRLYFLQHDAGGEFPLEDATFDWAYSEHMLEHLTPAQGVNWLREMRRLVRPGGHLRVTTPDLERYVDGYLDPDQAFYREHRRRLVEHALRAVKRNRFRAGDDGEGLDEVPERPAWWLNQIFRFWRHQWIYDFDELRHAAELAGFAPESVVRSSFRQGREREVYDLDLPIHDDETVYVEIERT